MNLLTVLLSLLRYEKFGTLYELVLSQDCHIYTTDEQTFVLPIITKVIPVENKAEKHDQDEKEENSLPQGPNDC